MLYLVKTSFLFIEKFKSGRINVKGKEGSVRPSILTTQDNIQLTKEMAIVHRRVTRYKVIFYLNITQGSVHQIIHNEFGFRKLRARCYHQQVGF